VEDGDLIPECRDAIGVQQDGGMIEEDTSTTGLSAVVVRHVEGHDEERVASVLSEEDTYWST
jgi:hypothetical protein